MHERLSSNLDVFAIWDNRSFVLSQGIRDEIFNKKVGAILFTILNTSHAISFILLTWRCSVLVVFKRS